MKKSVILLSSLLCGLMIMNTGCNTYNSMSQTGKSATVGGAAGAAVGTGIGALIGGGKGTWIGALVGSALGAGTGALIGNQMQKQKAALEAELGQVKDQSNQDHQIVTEMVKDRNDLDAIKLELGSSVLFANASSQLSPYAQAALSKVAYNLGQFPDTNVQVYGYTSSTGSEAYNMQLSQERAQAVVNYLISAGVNPARLQAIGEGESNPVASNATAEGQAQNRRVEIYITASKQMIDQYNTAQN